MRVYKEDGKIVDSINRAIDESRLLIISYVDASNKPSIRTVEPYEIKDGKFFAHCRTKDATRAFKVPMIQSADLLNETFTPRY